VSGPKSRPQRNIVEPTLVSEDKQMGDRTYEHPAWGMVQVSRVSGLVDLFGSALQHHHFVRLSIGSARKVVSDSGEDRHSGSIRGEIVEVLLSEAQWAQLLSSMNMGGGVPCTLNYISGERLPEMPPSAMVDQYHDAAKQQTQEIGQELLDLQKAIAERFADKKPLTIKEKEDLLGRVNSTVRALVDRLPFIQSMMQEALEKQVAAAKTEIDSFLQFKAQLLGFQQITEKIASLSDGKGEEEPLLLEAVKP
jgi:hypothetical protein